MYIPCKSKDSAGYTIVEAMVAVSILLLGVAAAAALSLTMVQQEEINARAARAVNWQENAVRLYQLGLGTASDTTEILDVMPGLPGLTSITVSTSTNNVDGGSLAVDVSDITLIYNSVDGENISRTSTMRAVRY